MLIIAPVLAGAGSLIADDKPADVRTLQTKDNSELPYTFRFKFESEVPYYYLIENDIRDSGGVPPLLSYSTTLKDRKTLIQRCNHPASQPVALPGSALVSLSWEVDRYEVRERGMKEESFYDSVRHLYPPPSLRELGTVFGSRATFLVDPATGQSSNLSTTPGVAGDATPRRGLMGKSAEKCMWNISTVKKLLDDMGPFYFPDGPVRIGDQWSRTFTEMPGPHGALTTKLNCTLRAVKDVEGRQVAVIDLDGDIVLQQPAKPRPASMPAGIPTTRLATSGPAQPPTPNNPSREFKLEKAVCNGVVEFDLTRGELISLSLQRETALAADIENAQMGKMQLRSGMAHSLKIKGSRTAPPKPVIVGGKVPPKIPDMDKQSAELFGPSRTVTSQPAKRRHGPAATAIPNSTNPALKPTGPIAPKGSKIRPGGAVTTKVRPPAQTTTQPAQVRPNPPPPTSQPAAPRD